MNKEDPARDGFSWDDVESRWLDVVPGGRFNIAYQALDRQVDRGRGDSEAMIWRGLSGERRTFSYRDLQRESARFAGALAARGIGLAERVSTIGPRRPEIYITALGTLRRGAVFAPLFSALGPDLLRQRLVTGEIRVVVTTAKLYRTRILPFRNMLPTLQYVVLIDGDAPGAESWRSFCRDADPIEAAGTSGEYPALLHFTSGTTGAPKAVLHVHRAATGHLATGRLVLELDRGTRFWCTADPGWVTGVTYGILAPLLCGATMVVDEGEFNTRRWRRNLIEEHVQSWLTTPTALRLFRRGIGERARKPPFEDLQRVFSTGEPLESGLAEWTRDRLGIQARDSWWQSETGMAMIAQYGDDPLTPGCMGRPVPGIEVALVRRNGKTLERVEAAGEIGEIAIRRGWPSMFRAYLGASDDLYRQSFVDGWYLSGDLAKCEADGQFRYISRMDDIINTAGQMVGPCEVEGILNRHPAVAESCAIGVPHAIAGELIHAWIVLRAPTDDAVALRRELIVHARERLGLVAAPRRIHFTAALPRTPSGKLLRREVVDWQA
ncbi:MAG: AMP-binding protein [Aquisalimonadaceae bacterium]